MTRQVYVVNNDTLVENPVIEEYVTGVLDMIANAAKEQGLPVTVKVTTPALEDTFWSCVIGKGYPVPNNSFRFCTEKMKIKPTSAFITSQVAADGEAIVLVGTRYDESQRRSLSIKRHEIKGHRLSKHPLNANTFTYAPIKSLRGFEKVRLAPGQTVKVNITLDGEAFEYYNPSIDELSTRPGRYQILYGTSSMDKDLQSLDFTVK